MFLVCINVKQCLVFFLIFYSSFGVPTFFKRTRYRLFNIPKLHKMYSELHLLQYILTMVNYYWFFKRQATFSLAVMVALTFRWVPIGF
jgi:hypothetical protein